MQQPNDIGLTPTDDEALYAGWTAAQMPKPARKRAPRKTERVVQAKPKAKPQAQPKKPASRGPLTTQVSIKTSAAEAARFKAIVEGRTGGGRIYAYELFSLMLDAFDEKYPPGTMRPVPPTFG